MIESQQIPNEELDSTDMRPAEPKQGKQWIISPLVDLLFICNVAWPIVLLVALGGETIGHERLRFWQVYFVTAPHRWVTLLLVVGNSKRFGRHKLLYIGIASVIVTLCVGTQIATGALTCLLLIDYLWNAWHFAAQHHGISRLYERVGLSGGTFTNSFDKWTMRVLLLYIIARVAGAGWGGSDAKTILQVTDWLVIALVLMTITREIFFRPVFLVGRTVYLASVYALFLTMLVCVRFEVNTLIVVVATVSALFHASEYLVIVTWSVQKQADRNLKEQDTLTRLAPQWLLTFGVFAVTLGLSGWAMNRHWAPIWLTANVIVAFLHYAYDGLIWRQSRAT